MEVHSHTSTPRKKWTHYFWEFLMLFLAVFCGFLAENWREHIVEHQRELQYMRSMIEDLRSDSAEFASSRNLRLSRLVMLDSLIYLLSQPDFTNSLNSIYYFGRCVSPPLNIFPNDRTIQQLKSSGALRLIRKPAVSNAIMAYDKQMRQHLYQLTDEVEMRADYRQFARTVFDGRVFSSMIQGDTIRRPTHNPPLFKSDPATLNGLLVLVQYFKKADEIYVKRTSELVLRATKLTEMIKKEYHLH